jgi:hypothetical protein
MNLDPGMQYIAIYFKITSPEDFQAHNLICQLVLLEVAQVVLVDGDIRDVLGLGLLEQQGRERGLQTVVQRVTLNNVRVQNETMRLEMAGIFGICLEGFWKINFLLGFGRRDLG